MKSFPFTEIIPYNYCCKDSAKPCSIQECSDAWIEEKLVEFKRFRGMLSLP